MKMSANGLKKLELWEGSERKAYRDVAGLLTIGVGHLLTQDELHSGKIYIGGVGIDYRRGLTKEQITDLLAQDLKGFEKVVNENVKVPLSQSQFDTLVSFSFNVGPVAFKNSTLLKVLNKKQYDEVPKQLRRWVYAGGNKVRGLQIRRENEIELWNS